MKIIFISLQDLKYGFNFGLYCPTDNGRAGKFLDEERRLGDYPFNGPIGFLKVSDDDEMNLVHCEIDFVC